MARPPRSTVDYFPHMVNHKQTIFILEQKYGNDGYAFWFKLLEMLGASTGHWVDCKVDATWQFLQAKTRVSADTCAEILDLLASLRAIDCDLWSEARVVWSQNFVDNLADVYKKRKTSIPEKPTLKHVMSRKELVSDPETLVSDPETTGAEGLSVRKPTEDGVIGAETPQSKVKESKVKKTKVNNNAPPDCSPGERAILAVLKDIPNWPFKYERDLSVIRDLAVDFPTVDLLTIAKRLKIWLVGKPLKPNSNPRLRLRNFCENEVKPRSNTGAQRGYRPARVYK